MADTTVLGSFLWHDLMTTDVESARTFYSKVVGWKTQAWEQNPDYILWVAKSGPIGGVMALPESSRSAGAKPHWLPYIGTPDIAATISQATGLGAVILAPATEIPNGGRYAILADPQGAMFGLYASANATVPGEPKLGEFSWHELATTDAARAFKFYQQLFGWEKTGEHDMGPMGTYLMFGLNGVPFGGVYNKHAELPAHWLDYASVADAAKAAKATTAAGGKVLNGPMEVPGGDWITQLADPQGAMFAVHARAKVTAAKPASKAAETAAPEAKPTAVEPAKPAKKAVVKTKAAKPTAKQAAQTKAPAKSKPKPAAKSKAPAKKKAAKKKSVAKPATKKKAGKKAAKKKAVSRPAAKRKAANKKKTASKKKAARKK